MGWVDDWAERWASRAAGPGPQHRPEPRALTAAGAKVNLRNPALSHTKRETWQTEAWNYREKIPEMRFAGDFVANTLGRLRVFPAENRPRGEEPVPLEAATKRQQRSNETGVDQATIDAACAAAERLNLNAHGSSLLSRIAENLEYSGEAFLVGERDDDGQEQWSVRSVSELQITTSGARLVDPDSQMQLRELRDDEADVMRLWNPHPRFYERPDAAVASLLDVLEGMFLIGRRGRAHDRSRISAGKGLYMPTEFMMHSSSGAPVSADLPGHIDDAQTNPLLTRLLEYAITPITDEGDPSAVVPLLFTGPATIDGIPGKDAIGTFDLHGEDPKNLDERYEALVMRFARGINLAPERVKGIGEATNTWCVDDQTEALTRRGWLRHDQLEVGDEILTLNHDTGMSEWHPVLDKFEKHVVDEPMMLMESRTHSSLTTLNHRWPVMAQRGGRNRSRATGEMVDGRRLTREWRTSETLRNADWLITSAPSGDLPAVAKYDDDFVELMAWYWTEGCCSHSVEIAQSHTVNPHRVDRIRSCLTRLFGPATEERLRPRIAEWRESRTVAANYPDRPITRFALSAAAAAGLRESAPDKIVSTEFVRALTHAQLELFLDVSAQADGWHYSMGGRLDMMQKDERALEAYELALILSGRTVTRSVCALSGGQGHYVGTSKAAKTRPRFGRGNVKYEPTTYTGVVWCPTTPTHSWFARRQGKMYFTGNTANVITQDEIKNHVEPRGERIVDALTAAYMTRMLKHMGIGPQQCRKICLWFSPDELTQNPNRGEDAKSLFQAGELSGDALRAATGFTEADAPSATERLRRQLATERLAPGSIPAMIAIEQGRMPTVDDITAVDRLNARLTGEGAGRPVVDATPHRAPPKPPVKAIDSPPPVGQRKQPATAPQPGSVTAAAKPAPQWRLERRLGQDLARVDRELTTRVLAHCDATVGLAISRAASRIRADAQKDPSRVVEFPKGADPVPIVAAAGRRIAPRSSTVDKLLGDAFTDLARLWDHEVGQAADSVEALLEAALTPGSVSQPRSLAAAGRVAGLADEVRKRGRAAWRGLKASLVDHSAKVLFGEHLPTRDGEQSPGVTPARLIRDAVAAAGGADSSTGPFGGVGTGPIALDRLRVSGALILGHEWEYGAQTRAHPFWPHKRLDETQFVEWDDPQLKADVGGFPDVTHYFPGDHLGCGCVVRPLAILPMTDGADPASDEVARLRAEALGQ